MRRLNGYKVIEMWWLSGIKNFVREMLLYSIRSETLSQLLIFTRFHRFVTVFYTICRKFALTEITLFACLSHDLFRPVVEDGGRAVFDKARTTRRQAAHKKATA